MQFFLNVSNELKESHWHELKLKESNEKLNQQSLITNFEQPIKELHNNSIQNGHKHHQESMPDLILEQNNFNNKQYHQSHKITTKIKEHPTYYHEDIEKLKRIVQQHLQPQTYQSQDPHQLIKESFDSNKIQSENLNLIHPELQQKPLQPHQLIIQSPKVKQYKESPKYIQEPLQPSIEYLRQLNEQLQQKTLVPLPKLRIPKRKLQQSEHSDYLEPLTNDFSLWSMKYRKSTIHAMHRKYN